MSNIKDVRCKPGRALNLSPRYGHVIVGNIEGWTYGPTVVGWPNPNFLAQMGYHNFLPMVLYARAFAWILATKIYFDRNEIER